MFQSITRVCAIGFILLLISSKPTVGDREAFNLQLLCTYLANNTVIKHPGDCNKYMTCVDGKVVTGMCEDDLFYDRNTGKCVAPNTVQCYSRDPCVDKANINGFLADPYDCNSYFYCRNGRGSKGFCSPGMNFNAASNTCIRNYACVLDTIHQTYCNIIPDGVFIKVPNSCSEYQVCWRGKLLNGTCPKMFYFNALTGKCDYATKFNCPGIAATPNRVPDDIECTVANVFISDGVSCNGYYYCQRHKDGRLQLIYGVCPFLRFFDASNGGACVIRTNTSCSHNRCITLGNHNIQLANIKADGCVGFYICQGGKVIGRSICPIGQYFNELLQLCTTNLVTYPACIRTNTNLVLSP